MKDDIWIIIPGIGNHQPGENLTALTRSLGAINNSPVQINKECHLIEQIENNHQTITFEVPLTTGKVNTHTTHFMELYWNDLSTVKSSWLGIAKALIKVILGLRHLIPPVQSETILGKQIHLIQFFFLLLRGPILAGSALVFILWFLLLTIFSVMKMTMKTGNEEIILNENLIWIFPVLSALIGIGILVFPFKIGGQKLLKNWTFRCMALLAFALIIALPIALKINITCCCFVTEVIKTLLIQPLKMLWGLANITLILLFITMMIQSIRYKLTEKPFIIIPSLLAMTTMAFWIAVIPIVLIASNYFTPESLKFQGMEVIVRNSMPTVGWVWIGTMILILSAAILWYNRSIWFKKNKNGKSTANSSPRLVFNKALFWVMIFISISVIIIFLLTNVPILKTTFIGNLLGEQTDVLRNIVIISVPILLPLFVYGKQNISLGLDITLDIINYFRPSGSQENMAISNPYSSLDFDLRNRIINRLDKIIQMANENFEIRKIVLVTHSQGTIFGLNYLSNPINKKRFKDLKVKLVTMGSPFTHIYQHYFPTHFNNDTIYKNIKNVVGENNWTNIYCSDDYIGTYIKNAPSQQDKNDQSFPKNIKKELGGHTGYFQDNRVLKELLRI
ncbi:hypothetical protein [Aquimarina sp. 2201CG14-23]|uniref:hypothetical protein n=1 Tax=Aquimarina mycalae TaxID=3040073 RepID=UPI002477D92D|nr:hypothetical protein [Aquimarina sp. 2201CG14-23]MDH7445580.1 hypothetical protein [Aquimarina sp. 2201CG14-23]